MKVIYTAPNRSHHYKYAVSLNKKGVLFKFISGFSRYNSRSPLPEIGDKLVRKDFLQTLFLLSAKLRLPKRFTRYLAYIAKIEQDRACAKYVKKADVFMFYNGSGYYTCKSKNSLKTVTVVEAVNSHVQYQEDLLKQEHKLHNLPWEPFPKKEKKRRLKEYDIADYIIMPSEFVRQSFIEYGFPEEKLYKVPFGFNKLDTIYDEDLKNKRKVDDPLTILYVGSISVRKGLIYLIEAFNKFSYEDKRLIIVGPTAKLTGIEGVDIPDNVMFTGVLKGDELNNMYKAADVFCLPTIEEGLALVLGEALSFGIPIVTTVNSGAADLIDNGKEGFIVPIRSSEAIKEKLEVFVSDTDLYNQMRENAIKKASKLNGWDSTGDHLCNVLAEMFEKGKLKN